MNLVRWHAKAWHVQLLGLLLLLCLLLLVTAAGSAVSPGRSGPWPSLLAIS